MVDWEDHPLWDADPALKAYRGLARNARPSGYAGPYDRKASEVFAKYIIVDMYAKVVQGTDTPKTSVAWAEKELQHVYGRS